MRCSSPALGAGRPGWPCAPFGCGQGAAGPGSGPGLCERRQQGFYGSAREASSAHGSSLAAAASAWCSRCLGRLVWCLAQWAEPRGLLQSSSGRKLPCLSFTCLSRGAGCASAGSVERAAACLTGRNQRRPRQSVQKPLSTRLHGLRLNCFKKRRAGTADEGLPRMCGRSHRRC